MMALLSACGAGNIDTQANNGAVTVTAATMVSSSADAAPDCQADHCPAPGATDGLAEEYRAAAGQRQALEAVQPPLAELAPALTDASPGALPQAQ